MNKLQEDNEVLKGLVKDLTNPFNIYMKEQKKEEINKQAELKRKLVLIEAQLTS